VPVNDKASVSSGVIAIQSNLGSASGVHYVVATAQTLVSNSDFPESLREFEGQFISEDPAGQLCIDPEPHRLIINVPWEMCCSSSRTRLVPRAICCSNCKAEAIILMFQD
jgi:hypothetical protein